MFELVVNQHQSLFSASVVSVYSLVGRYFEYVDPDKCTIPHTAVEYTTIRVKNHTLATDHSIFPMRDDELIINSEQHPHTMWHSIVLWHLPLIFGIAIIYDEAFANSAGYLSFRAVWH